MNAKVWKIVAYIGLALVLGVLDSALEIPYYKHISTGTVFYLFLGVGIALHIVALVCSAEHAKAADRFAFFSKMGLFVAVTVGFSMISTSLAQFSVYQIDGHTKEQAGSQIAELQRQANNLQSTIEQNNAQIKKYIDLDYMQLKAQPLQDKNDTLISKRDAILGQIAALSPSAGLSNEKIYQPLADFLHISTTLLIAIIVVIKSFLLNTAMCIFAHRGFRDLYLYLDAQRASGAGKNSKGNSKIRQDARQPDRQQAEKNWLTEQDVLAVIEEWEAGRLTGRKLNQALRDKHGIGIDNNKAAAWAARYNKAASKAGDNVVQFRGAAS